ncbi:hypothetical protein CTI14_15340, partial [Methylobacterium radiotolerans]
GGTEEAVDRRIRRPIEDDMGADKSLARDTIFRRRRRGRPGNTSDTAGGDDLRGGTEEAVDRRIRRPIEDDMGADKSLARDTIFRSAAGLDQRP